MQLHLRSLFPLVKRGGRVHYIIGNSKFYDVLLPAERILVSLLESAGFVSSKIKTIRKRSSKKELFEYVVSAEKPGAQSRCPSHRAPLTLPSRTRT